MNNLQELHEQYQGLENDFRALWEENQLLKGLLEKEKEAKEKLRDRLRSIDLILDSGDREA
jgi:hypothetical protein